MNKFILVLVTLFHLANSLKFFFKVPGVTMKCLGEYLTENTVGIGLIYFNSFIAIFSLNAESDQILVRLIDPNGNLVYNKVHKFSHN